MKSWPFLVCLWFLCAMAAGAPVEAFGKFWLTLTCRSSKLILIAKQRRRWKVQVVSSLQVAACALSTQEPNALSTAVANGQGDPGFSMIRLSLEGKKCQCQCQVGWEESGSFRETLKFIGLCVSRLYQASLIMELDTIIGLYVCNVPFWRF